MFISYYFNRQMWAHIFFNLLVAELECTHRVCAWSVFVVRHFMYFKRFSSYRADVSCCTKGMCYLVTIYTGRCGHIFFFNLFVAEFE